MILLISRFSVWESEISSHVNQTSPALLDLNRGLFFSSVYSHLHVRVVKGM